MATVVPSSLPEIDSVEVVSLRGLLADRADEYMAIAAGARRVLLFGINARRIASLWRSLPEGEQSRCHTPPFGVRFFSKGSMICEASICWGCNNIFGQAGADSVFYKFDGEQPVSRELLKACENALGESAEE